MSQHWYNQDPNVPTPMTQDQTQQPSFNINSYTAPRSIQNPQPPQPNPSQPRLLEASTQPPYPQTPVPSHPPTMITRTIHQPQLSPPAPDRIDQHQFVTHRLANSATPNLVAAMAMIIQQMDAQLANPGMELAISTSFGPLKLAAKFKRGEWVGHDLTYPPDRRPCQRPCRLRNLPCTNASEQDALPVSATVRDTTTVHAPPVNATTTSSVPAIPGSDSPIPSCAVRAHPTINDRAATCSPLPPPTDPAPHDSHSIHCPNTT